MGPTALNELIVWLDERGHLELAELARACIRELGQAAADQRRMTAGFLIDEIMRRLLRGTGPKHSPALEFMIQIGQKTMTFEEGMADLGSILVFENQNLEARLIVNYKGKSGGPPVCLDRQGIFLHAARSNYSFPLALPSGSGGTLKISLVVDGTKISLHAGYRIIAIRNSPRGILDCGTIDRLESDTSGVEVWIPVVPWTLDQQVYDVSARVGEIEGECRMMDDFLVVSFSGGTDFVTMVRQDSSQDRADREGSQRQPVFTLNLSVPGQDPLRIRARIRIAAPQSRVSVHGRMITVSSDNGIPGVLRIVEDEREVFRACCAEVMHTVSEYDHDPDLVITMDGREIFHQKLALREQFRIEEQRRLLPIWILLALLEPGFLILAIYGIVEKNTGFGVLGVLGFVILTVGLAISTLNRILDEIRETNALLAIGLGILAFIFWPVSLTLLGILAIFRPWIEIRETLSRR